MNKIIDLLKTKQKTVSFEFFPPKTDEGYKNLLNTIDELSKFNPDFISITYGAGGGNRDKTFDIAQLVQEKHKIPAMAHLTCVLNTREQVKTIIEDIRSRGITNILALRGDPPKEQPNWQPGPENFPFAKDLCAFIREHHEDYFSIGVAGFPEGHFRCQDRELDAKYLKMKINHGADFVITQLFLDNRDYFQFCNRLKNNDVNVPVLPGILPITNYQSLVNFCSKDNITIPTLVKETFEPIQDDTQAVFEKGIEFAVNQCQKLLEGGAPGIHFYSLNKVEPVKTIIQKLKIR